MLEQAVEGKKTTRKRATKAQVEALQKEVEGLRQANTRLLSDIGNLTADFLNLVKEKNALERGARLPPSSADVFALMAQVLLATGTLSAEDMRKIVESLKTEKGGEK